MSRVHSQCCLKTSAKKSATTDTLTSWEFARNVRARAQLVKEQSTPAQFVTEVKKAQALASVPTSTLTSVTLSVQLTLRLLKKIRP